MMRWVSLALLVFAAVLLLVAPGLAQDAGPVVPDAGPQEDAAPLPEARTPAYTPPSVVADEAGLPAAVRPTVIDGRSWETPRLDALNLGLRETQAREAAAEARADEAGAWAWWKWGATIGGGAALGAILTALAL